MSDTTNSADPTLDYLRERRTNLLRQADEINVRINEIDALMNVLEDGRSRVNRQRRTRGNGPTPGAAEHAPLPDQHVAGGTHSDKTVAGDGL